MKLNRKKLTQLFEMVSEEEKKNILLTLRKLQHPCAYA